MHDLADYEARGIASVMVASSEFVHAAQKQAEALGLPELGESVTRRTDHTLLRFPLPREIFECVRKVHLRP